MAVHLCKTLAKLGKISKLEHYKISQFRQTLQPTMRVQRTDQLVLGILTLTRLSSFPFYETYQVVFP